MLFQILGAVERKVPRDKYPEAKLQAKNAANRTGLNARQRVLGTGKYSEAGKAERSKSRKTK